MTTIRLTNIGIKQLTELDMNVPVVSIRDKYSSQATIPNINKRKVAYLCFSAIDHLSYTEGHVISKEDVKSVINLIKKAAEENKEKIYFQCTEGRIRSYTLANAFYEISCFSDEGILELTGIKLEYCNKDSALKAGIIDKGTYNRIHEIIDELNKEYQESQTHE